MFKYYFEQVENVEVWPIISLVIFLTFFVGLLIWVVKVDKKYIKEMSDLPMDDATENTKNTLDYA